MATSLEEHNRMTEQVELSKKRVKELEAALKVKKDNLDKYVKESKEANDQARFEIDYLKKARTDLTAEKYQNENQLRSNGQAAKEESERIHIEKMNQLQRLIEDLTAEYNAVKVAH